MFERAWTRDVSADRLVMRIAAERRSAGVSGVVRREEI